MPITREKKLYRAMTIISGSLIFLTVIGTVLSLYLHLFNTDKLTAFMTSESRYDGGHIQLRFFQDNQYTTAFIILGVIVFAVAIAITILTGIKANRISQRSLPERRGALQIIRIFAGFSMLAIPVLYAIFSMYGFELGKFQGNINLLAMLLAVPGSLYFLFPGITDRFSEFLQFVFGVCLIGFTVFSLITTHVYMYEGLTSPIRACNLLSLVAMMLFILYEIRFFASKPLPNMYLATMGLAMYFCATNGIPRLIATAVGEMEVSLQTIYAVVETMIALYAICRMLLFISEWKYTLQTAGNEEEDLPQTVSLVPNTNNETVEPDYTEDSDIESPILAAEIDLNQFDRAFSGEDATNNDVLDEMFPTAPEEDKNAEEFDPLADSELSLLLDEVNQSVQTESPVVFEDAAQESPSENEAENDEQPANSDDDFDALTDEMFGS